MQKYTLKWNNIKTLLEVENARENKSEKLFHALSNSQNWLQNKVFFLYIHCSVNANKNEYLKFT